MYGLDVDAAAQAHALAEWPRESVGYVVGDAYVPQSNIALDPVREFAVADSAWSDDVQAVIHSHTISLDRAPGAADMRSQISAGVPFGILATDGNVATPILWFGDHVLDEPLVGRTFVPGVTDCYELVRAWMWQERKIKLRPFARDADWWERGGDLLAQSFEKAGCKRISVEDARAGDGLLMAIPATGIINHCAVLLGGGLMLHHRAGQLSRREPWSGAWRRLTRMVVRFGITNSPDSGT